MASKPEMFPAACCHDLMPLPLKSESHNDMNRKLPQLTVKAVIVAGTLFHSLNVDPQTVTERCDVCGQKI
jgi:hypothetical protein